MAAPGRNDLCACGSGKKFKHCCLLCPQAATGITAQDRTDAFAALMKYSRRDEFDPMVAASAREWADMPDVPVAEALAFILSFETSAQAFFDWLFFDVPGRDGATIADRFLDSRGWTLTPRAIDYIRLMRPTHLRLYQVRRVERGAGLDVRDMWTKSELFITERQGSTHLVKWDVVAARVVPHADGTNQFEGAIMALPPSAAKPLMKELRAEFRAFARWDAESPLADFFKQSAPLIHDAWIDEVTLRERPILTTIEGDPLTTNTIVFEVPAAGEALATLLSQPDFEPGPFVAANWFEDSAGHRRLLGDVVCDTGTLTMTTMSRPRAERLHRRLEEILGPLTVIREEHRDFDPADTLPRTDESNDENRDDDTAEALASWLRDQDRQWLDISVPALDGRTPREAARDRRLRPRLRELLIEIENQQARLTPGAGRDVSWLWKELRLRRS